MPSSQIQWATYKKLKVEWEAQIGMCPCSTSTFKDSWGCTVPGMLETRHMTEQLNCHSGRQSNHHKWLLSQKTWSVEELWDTTFRCKAKDIPSNIRRRAAQKEEVLDLLWKNEKGSSVRPALELFQRWWWGSFREIRWSVYMGFLECVDTVWICSWFCGVFCLNFEVYPQVGDILHMQPFSCTSMGNCKCRIVPPTTWVKYAFIFVP